MALLDASPLLEIIGIRKRAQELIEGVRSGNTENLIEFKNLAAEEKRPFAIAEKQKSSLALIERRVKLDIELQDLRNELYWIERNDS